MSCYSTATVPAHIAKAFDARMKLHAENKRDSAGRLPFRPTTMTKQLAYELVAKLSVERYTGEFVCLAQNLKNGLVTQACAEALIDYYPAHCEKEARQKEEEVQQYEMELEINKKRKAEKEAEDAKYEWVAEKVKCGGKGQVQVAWTKVAKKNSFEEL